MTKREFDRLTKRNLGADSLRSYWETWGADGTRQGATRYARPEPSLRRFYRENRLRLAWGADYISARAAEIRRTRRGRYPWEPPLPTLGRGSRFRAPQRYFAQQGLPLLTSKREPELSREEIEHAVTAALRGWED